MPLSPSSSRLLRPIRQGAFSVLELLVVSAVIAVLLVLLATAGNRVRQQMRKTQCLANLWQIGVAFSLYVGENDGRLPGPMTGGQRLGYSLVFSDQYHIPRILGKYLDLPPATSTTQFAGSISCPAWLAQLQPGAQKNSAPAYTVTSITVDGEVRHPLGRSSDLTPPMRYAAVPEPGKQRALVEADALVAPTWGAQIPASPVHGAEGRHTLFFDWHAESVP